MIDLRQSAVGATLEGEHVSEPSYALVQFLPGGRYDVQPSGYDALITVDVGRATAGFLDSQLQKRRAVAASIGTGFPFLDLEHRGGVAAYALEFAWANWAPGAQRGEGVWLRIEWTCLGLRAFRHNKNVCISPFLLIDSAEEVKTFFKLPPSGCIGGFVTASAFRTVPIEGAGELWCWDEE